jgi:hypothetical protein
MNSDFLDAHKRHWQDAERLFTASRLANADHLYGLSAECGLKRLMISFGMKPKTDEDDTPYEKADRVHVTETWVRYESYRSGRSAGTDYVLPPSNLFSDWDVSQRYGKESEFGTARVEAHRAGADYVRSLIKKAEMDGRIHDSVR